MSKLALQNAIKLSDIIKNLPPERKRHVEFYRKYYETLINLRKRREDLGITQEKLAKTSGVSRDTIIKIESGKRNPTLDTFFV